VESIGLQVFLNCW